MELKNTSDDFYLVFRVVVQTDVLIRWFDIIVVPAVDQNRCYCDLGTHQSPVN